MGNSSNPAIPKITAAKVSRQTQDLRELIEQQSYMLRQTAIEGRVTLVSVPL